LPVSLCRAGDEHHQAKAVNGRACRDITGQVSGPSKGPVARKDRVEAVVFAAKVDRGAVRADCRTADHFVAGGVGPLREPLPAIQVFYPFLLLWRVLVCCRVGRVCRVGGGGIFMTQAEKPRAVRRIGSVRGVSRQRSRFQWQATVQPTSPRGPPPLPQRLCQAKPHSSHLASKRVVKKQSLIIAQSRYRFLALDRAYPDVPLLCVTRGAAFVPRKHRTIFNNHATAALARPRRVYNGARHGTTRCRVRLVVPLRCVRHV
jgi:hypothetical protein